MICSGKTDGAGDGRGRAVARARAHDTAHVRAEALAYGAAFVPVFSPRPWEDVAELVRNGWASRYGQVADGREDWRLSWPAVKGLAGCRRRARPRAAGRAVAANHVLSRNRAH